VAARVVLASFRAPIDAESAAVQRFRPSGVMKSSLGRKFLRQFKRLSSVCTRRAI
jgi:hypothetical protein